MKSVFTALAMALAVSYAQAPPQRIESGVFTQHLTVAIHAAPQRGVPNGTGVVSIGRPFVWTWPI